jgi:carbonic anhydrase
MIYSLKRNNKLFFSCPDCYIEHKIRSKFGGNIFFLTALGAVFNSTDSIVIESIHLLIEQEKITEIYIVNDTSCRFVESVIKVEKGYNTSSEMKYRKLLSCNLEVFNHLVETKVPCTELAKLNLISKKNRFMERAQSKEILIGQINRINPGFIRQSER